MENPLKFQPLEPSRDSRRRRCSYPSSPEFEFWMVSNPSLPQPNLLTADELFVDGVLLPLHLVSASASASAQANIFDFVSASAPSIESTSSNLEQDSKTTVPDPETSSGPEITACVSASEPVSGSRRWTDIFKKSSDSKPTKEAADHKPEKVKGKRKKERKASGGGHSGGSSGTAELNINIWPFSRSRSAGNNMTRPRTSTGSRKVSSAPCSRSNSGGESKSRKWPASPARGGVHLGRSSPVWQVRRPAVPKSSQNRDSGLASDFSGGGKGKDVLSLNASMRTGCKMSAAVGGGGEASEHSRKGSGGSNDGSGVANLFNLRGLFSKKVY